MWFGVRILLVLIWPLTRIRSLTHSHQPLPPITNQLLLNSAQKTAHLIRRKEVSCVIVVEAFIARIKEVNPLLNAVVDERFSLALEEAKQVDLLLESGNKSVEEIERETPLLGVPLTVKESVSVKGCSNNSGRIVPKERIAESDAETVRLLRQAGVIVLCVTNTPELCMNWETFNKATGTTKNPYDTRRTPGGSSGGEAALLSSGASIIGVASDIAGSCRIPAMFTGVFGHKPSPGFVSNAGHMPSSNDHMWNSYFTIGLMTRYAEDLPLMLHLMVSNREMAKSLRLLEPVSLQNIRVFYMEDNGSCTLTDSVDKDIKEGLRKAIHHLEYKQGIKAQKVNIDLEDVFELVSMFLLKMEGIQCAYEQDDEHPEIWTHSVTKEVLKWAMFRSKYTSTSVLYGIIKKAADCIPQRRIERLLLKKNDLIKKFRDMLGDNGVFLFPTFINSAHFHYQIHYKFLNYAYVGLFNLLEMPVTNVTVGLGSNKMPVGFQVATSPTQDRLSMAIARELEIAFGGWVPPSSVSVL
uniref:Fatty-acid amide hydrolase 2 n=2 Tax=Cacopsylla melanoneura TaxID=428564 RepID=A0A8D8WXM2_9HEMI